MVRARRFAWPVLAPRFMVRAVFGRENRGRSLGFASALAVVLGLGTAASVGALLGACSTAELRAPGSSSSGGDGPGVKPVEDEDGGASTSSGGPAAPAPPPPVSSDVTIQVQPTDSGAALLAAIKGAQKSVHMTMYLLTSYETVDALVDLKNAGKDVKVILNQTFPPNGGSNADSYAELKAKGVPVVWAPSAYQFTHSKSIVIDGEKLIVMTMNMTYTSAQTNREYIATDLDPDDVRDAETIFDADYRNVNAHLATTKLLLSPRDATSVDARTRLVALIDSAKTSIDVETQSLSDDALVDALIAAHQAGVAVRIVLDGDTLHTTGQEEAAGKLVAAGVPLRGVSKPDIHAKAIVVDRVRTFVGSMNLTPTALSSNREMGIITDAADEATKVAGTIAGDFGKGTPF